MTEQEAKERCARLSAEDPERTTHSWMPREGADGDWSVVKLAVPTPGTSKLVATTSEDEQAIKNDPRPPIVQGAGPGAIGM